MIVYEVLLLLLAFILVIYYLAKKYPKMRDTFAFVSIFVLMLFTIWRIFFTVPNDTIISLVFGWIFLVAEIVGLIVFSFFILLVYDYHPDSKDEDDVSIDYSFNPSVDIFICTYNEDIKLVLATAHAAKALPYKNKTIYVCDDGHRKDLELFCKSFDVGYLARADGEFAKAGNINYAISQSKSEFFVVLDADFMVKENFIYRAISYFKDPNVALVQYPQAFYNKDPFQLVNSSFYNEQELFMRFFEPALAKDNALIHIGTNALFRRSSIEAIGGIPTSSITEDMATGLLLQNAGYKTVYINEVYALGITPHSVKDLADQRRRWAKGAMQIFKSYRPRKLKGLNLKQKICYYNGYFYWLTSIQKLIYMLVPTLFMAFGIFVVNSSLSEWVLLFIPPMVLIVLSFRLYMPSIRTFTTSHIYDSFVAPIHAGAIIKEIFVHEKNFKVTKKTVSNEHSFDYKTVLPHLVITMWIIVAIFIALYKLFEGAEFKLGYLVTIAWSCYNLYGLINAIMAAKSRDILSDADALSVIIDEVFLYDNKQYRAIHFNYNGFRITKIDSSLELFKKGDLYHFTIVQDTIHINARCIEVNDEFAVFSFERISPEAGVELAKYYSKRLHAAKPVRICNNT